RAWCMGRRIAFACRSAPSPRRHRERRIYMARIVRCVAMALATLSLSHIAPAQQYPARTVRLVASSTGGVELVARIVAEKLSQSFGHQVIVDPRTGAA